MSKGPPQNLYEILQGLHKAAEERNKALTDRATGLLGFAGVINTVLLAIIMSTLDEKKMDILKTLPSFPYLKAIVILGFIFYILSAIFALLAYKVSKYFPAPQIGSIDYITEVFEGKTELSMKHLSIQLFEGVQFYDKVNKEKFWNLFFATVCLLLAIAFTASSGILLFISI